MIALHLMWVACVTGAVRLHDGARLQVFPTFFNHTDLTSNGRFTGSILAEPGVHEWSNHGAWGAKCSPCEGLSSGAHVAA